MSVHVITENVDMPTMVEPVESSGTGTALPHARATIPSWSLQGRLPLLICGLLASVVLAFGAAAYFEVRDAAIVNSIDRLRGLARESINTATRSTARLAQLQVAATDSNVARVLSETTPAPATIAAATRSVRGMLAAADTVTFLRLDFWRADGRRVDGAVAGIARPRAPGTPAFTSISPRDSAMLARVFAGARSADSLYRSPLFQAGEETRFWSVFPVMRDGHAVGYIAELRRFAGAVRVEQALRRLSGPGTMGFIAASADADTWATLGGRPFDAPFRLRPDSRAQAWTDSAPTIDPEPYRYTDASGAVHYAATAVVPSSPWLLVLTQPEAALLERPREFLRRLLFAGVIILLAGTVGAWIMSRHVTRPLVRLREAADAMAGGDYTARVSVDGSTETAALAQAFNTMADHTGEARAILQEQNDSLRRANEAKARFLAMMSHELRTPLNAIGGYADLISLGVRGPTTPEQEQDLERIRRNKNQLLTLISDILQFSRLDAGQIVVRPQTVQLGPEFAAVREMLDGQFSHKGVLLVVPAAEGAVDADPARLHQVLVNLLANALNATATGGTVRLTASRQDRWTEIMVSDTGVGIAPEMQGAIFEPFVQVDTSLTRPVGGTGLGLAIVRELTTAMGGTVRVESTVGVGSTFIVRLPTAAVVEPPAPMRAERGDAAERPVLVGSAA